MQNSSGTILTRHCRASEYLQSARATPSTCIVQSRPTGLQHAKVHQLAPSVELSANQVTPLLPAYPTVLNARLASTHTEEFCMLIGRPQQESGVRGVSVGNMYHKTHLWSVPALHLLTDIVDVISLLCLGLAMSVCTTCACSLH